jgi:hypothetical protein
MDKADLLHDTELCAALGMFPGSGCCVRHPNIAIISKSEEEGEESVHTCKICESEFLSGGLRQRRSFAFAIMQVQKLHNDKLGWNQFKQNWDTGSMISAQSGETKESEDDRNICFMPNAVQDRTPLRIDRYKPSSILKRPNKPQVAWKEYTWQIVLRTTQVQEWAIAEKDKELSLLRSKLQRTSGDIVETASDEPSSTAAAAPTENNNASMSTLLTGSKDEASPYFPYRMSSSSEQSPNFNKFAANEALLDPQEEDLNDGRSDFKVEEAPKPPKRQMSNDLPISISPILDVTDRRAGSAAFALNGNSNRGFGRLSNRGGSSFQARVPPTLPTRRPSNDQLLQPWQQQQHRESNLSNMSELTSPTLFSAALSTDSSTFTYDGSAFLSESEVTQQDISVALSAESDVSGGFGRSDTKKSLDTIISEEFVLEDFVLEDRKQPSVQIDQYTPSTILGGSDRKQPPKQHQQQPEEKKNEHTKSEISFVPPALDPPPPPPLREDSIAVPQTAGATHGNKDIELNGSQDIRFDVSQTPAAASGKAFLGSSISDMQFSDKDKLLQEASRALATPHSIAGRKLRTSDFKKIVPMPSLLGNRAVTDIDFHKEKLQEQAKGNPTDVRGKLTDAMRPISADAILLRRERSDSKTTPPGEKKRANRSMNLGAFFENRNKNDDSDQDEIDEFGDLPVNSGFIRVPERSGSLSPVSCVTMLTTDPMSVVGGPPEEEVEPKKGLQNRGKTKLLPMEEMFHSDDEESTQVSKQPEMAAGEVVDQIVNDKYGDSGLYTGSVSSDALVPHGRGGK